VKNVLAAGCGTDFFFITTPVHFLRPIEPLSRGMKWPEREFEYSSPSVSKVKKNVWSSISILYPPPPHSIAQIAITRSLSEKTS
jgi:hypothetical protein